MKELVIVVDDEYLSGLEKYKNYQVQHYVRHEMERFNKRQSFLLHINTYTFPNSNINTTLLSNSVQLKSINTNIILYNSHNIPNG